MILYDANAPGPNPVTVRLFAHERGGLGFDVVTIDLVGLENRKRPYLTGVNARGEVPALRLDDGSVLTEITAICGSASTVTGRMRLRTDPFAQPPTGSQARVRPKTIWKTGATTKFGIVRPRAPRPVTM